jgi:hypothetical protein
LGKRREKQKHERREKSKVKKKKNYKETFPKTT